MNPTIRIPNFFPLPMAGESVEHACLLHRHRLLRARIFLLNDELSYAQWLVHEPLDESLIRERQVEANRIDEFRRAIEADRAALEEVLKATRLEE